jgi:ribosomal protein L29
MTNKRLDEIRKRIHQIKAELAAIDDMRPGSLTRQYKDPKNQSGAYYQLSYTRQMKSRTEYVARDCVREVRREIANYKRFKALTEQWGDLGIEQSRLRMKLARRP